MTVLYATWKPRHGGWFRLCGYGLIWKDTRSSRLSFSERNGFVRGLHIGPWYIRFLRRNGL